ncbi:hypothetical protein M404DRAFT_835515 [Pisolithus tinctorius Marx 270]|uniref:Uncharacterized protein n=1 Tax=Pisolithus tinctorius Marx 270 TaxID=870435 RepID=A0A0C3KNJ1_PISTI|nr:hypothetical protein M404DRAFT_835515 [Pisolithus tinctorius Marx 270]
MATLVERSEQLSLYLLVNIPKVHLEHNISARCWRVRHLLGLHSVCPWDGCHIPA